MRVRLSRSLGLLAKAGMVLWLMWLTYLLITRTASYNLSSFSGSAGAKDDSGMAVAARGAEEDGEALRQPVYQKPVADSNAPGEWGRAARLTLTDDEKKQQEESIERYAINIFVSDHISLHRHIQDNRMHE